MMRTLCLVGMALSVEAQPLPPKGGAIPLQELIQQGKPSGGNGNREIRRFRDAVSNSRPALQRGGGNVAWDEAMSYLGRFEGTSTDPLRRLELANAYQELGDLMGGPYGWNAGQSGRAVASYQRAMFLLGGRDGGWAGMGSRGMPRGYGQSLESLATRLTLLNAPFFLLNGGGFGGAQPIEPPRQALPVQPTPPLANVPLPRADTSPEGVEVTEQFATVSGRAQALLGSVDDLRQSLGARGLTIHEDIAGSLGRVRLYMELAAVSIEQGAWANARRQLEKADYEAGKLARHLGR